MRPTIPVLTLILTLVLSMLLGSCSRKEVAGKSVPTGDSVRAESARPRPEDNTGKGLRSGAEGEAPGNAAPLRLTGGASSPDSLIRAFMAAVLAEKGSEAYSFLPTFDEYVALYPHMPEADRNPDSPRMISGMLVSSNRKELPRWLKDAESLRGLARYTLGPEEEHDGYAMVTRARIFVLDEKGVETEFPLFRTLIRVGDRYKIWILLEH